MHPVIANYWATRPLAPPDIQPTLAPYDALAAKNPHPWDARIIFRESDHAYGICDAAGRWVTEHIASATKVLDPYKKPFGSYIATNVAKGQVTLQEKFEAGLAEARPYMQFKDGTVLYLPAANMTEALEYIRTLPDDKREALLYRYFGDACGCHTAEAVRALWMSNTRHGTEMHAQIEQYLNGGPTLYPTPAWNYVQDLHREHNLTPVQLKTLFCDPAPPDWTQFKEFLADHADREVYRTEWRIMLPSCLLTGTIDCVLVAERDAEGRVVVVDLVDWKFKKDIHDSRDKKKPAPLKPPFSHLPDNTFTECSIQLNVYRHMIETSYGLRVRYMRIIAMHTNYPTYQVLEIPRLEAETERLIFEREKRLVEKIASLSV